MKRLTWKKLIANDPGGDGRYCCPFPPCDEKPVDAAHRSLTVDPDTGAYLCHRCNRSGRLGIPKLGEGPPGEASLRLGIPAPGQGVEGLSEALRPIAGQTRKKEKGTEWKELWDEAERASTQTENIIYLEERGVEVNDDVRFHPSFYGEPSIVFGLRNWYGELVGCQARRIDPKEGSSKVITGAGSQAGIFLSSKEAILADPLIITEAPIDALSLEQLGYPAISVQGTNYPDWINYLTYYRTVVVAPDNDEPGRKAAESWKNRIISQRNVVVLPPFGKDWNESMLIDRYGTDEYLRDNMPARYSGEHALKEALKKWFDI